MEHAYNLRRTGIRRARSPSHSSSSRDNVGDQESAHASPGVAGAFGDTETDTNRPLNSVSRSATEPEPLAHRITKSHNRTPSSHK